MGWYRRSSGFAFTAFRNLFNSSAKAHSKNPIPHPISRTDLCNPFTPTATRPRVSVFSQSYPIIARNSLGFRNTSPFTNIVARRYYYVDRRQIRHFKPRGIRNWVSNPRGFFIIVLVGSGVAITIYYGNLETVPYTKRKHFVVLSKDLERKIGEAEFEKIKKGFKGKILPAIHPESVRVRLIARDIIEALQRGLKKEQVWTDTNYASEHSAVHDDRGLETLVALTENPESQSWHRDDEVLDDKWVHQSRKKAKEKGSQASSAATGHLENLNWEVLVVNEPTVNAFCLPGGKIVVFTGLLEHFRTNAEIATIIGHEVAHAVARHSAEQITKNMWFAIAQLILYQFIMPDLVNAMSNLLLRLPFSRRMEIEADYIGLLLMASAGYDPRVAPKVFEKLGKVTGDSAVRDYLSTHPSGKKRAKLLSEAEVMKEALALYRESMAGREIEGFFL